ncbi:MAG: MoxR family ATPase [Betaproteobacteria bacterium]|nr:MAG: MoxR family ATPase [Betaproteobacteria bacterium]
MSISSEDLARVIGVLEALRRELSKAVVGQREVVDQTLAAFVASGHVLIEGVPGLGKTLLARALAKAMTLGFTRVQFTPDLMPTDITGHAVLDRDPRGESPGSAGTLRIVRGPVFTNLLLADEINRAPAKTQSALLEVMQEYQVTLEGRSMPLPRPFVVIGTQNPIETEGTYPLPEAQLDRFLVKIRIGYPTHQEESDIVRRTTEQATGDELPLAEVTAQLDERAAQALQRIAAFVRVDPRVADYAVRIARTTRDWPGLATGAGPRGAIALVRLARAAALLEGRDYATPDDVKRYALPTLRHRVALAPDAQLEGRDVDILLASAVDSIDAPRL